MDSGRNVWHTTYSLDIRVEIHPDAHMHQRAQMHQRASVAAEVVLARERARAWEREQKGGGEREKKRDR